MTKVNFKTELLDAEGKPGTPSMLLSTLLSNVIMGSSITDELLMKYFDWAMELNRSGELNLDNTDKEKLTAFIRSSGTLNVLCKGRLLNAIAEGTE